MLFRMPHTPRALLGAWDVMFERDGVVLGSTQFGRKRLNVIASILTQNAFIWGTARHLGLTPRGRLQIWPYACVMLACRTRTARNRRVKDGTRVGCCVSCDCAAADAEILPAGGDGRLVVMVGWWRR